MVNGKIVEFKTKEMNRNKSGKYNIIIFVKYHNICVKYVTNFVVLDKNVSTSEINRKIIKLTKFMILTVIDQNN